jgi:hypothetical protein
MGDRPTKRPRAAVPKVRAFQLGLCAGLALLTNH